ncbi:MAG: hypothetical protein ACK5XS_02810 [Armatimonadota bacterium]|nr:hypothetical protein [Fimbriimonadaceae bacterium]
MTVIEFAPGSLDLPQCVTSGMVFRWTETAPGEWHGADGPHEWRLHWHPDRIELHHGDVDALRSLLRLDEDLDAVRQAIAAADPDLAACWDARPGFRLLRPLDPVEATIGFLCTSNNSLHRIVPMVRWLAARAPGHTFPDLDVIANLSEHELREARFGYRAVTIPRAAAQLAASGGRAHLLNLRQAPYEDAKAYLLSLPGVGPKLADCIALFALHHTAAVPVDTHVWQQAVRRYFPEWAGQSLTPARMNQVGDALRKRFGIHAAWAQQLLFQENLRPA